MFKKALNVGFSVAIIWLICIVCLAITWLDLFAWTAVSAVAIAFVCWLIMGLSLLKGHK